MGALTKSKEFEIRMRYELGEDLNKLAVIYKVPLTTLNKRKKLSEVKGDPWIKGSRSRSAYKKFVENDEATRRELREKINSEAREEIAVLSETLKEVYKNPEAKLFEAKIENAVMARTKRIEKFLEIRRNIEDIPTLKEEAEIEKIKMDIELKRYELKEKAIELKLKTAEAKILLGDDETDDIKICPKCKAMYPVGEECPKGCFDFLKKQNNKWYDKHRKEGVKLFL